MTTIITKNGSGAPTAGQLTTGELAVDLTNKELYTKDSGGNVIKVGAQGGSTGTFTNLTATSSFTSPGIDDNANATAITIDSSENVGIGTVSPVTAVEVEGSETELMRLSSTSGNGGGVVGVGSLGLDFFSGSTHPAVLLSARESGIATYTSQFAISLRASNADTAPTERFRINSLGNVGIGTDSPNQLLTLGSDTGSATIGLDFETSSTSRGSVLYNAALASMDLTSGYAGYGGQFTFTANGSEAMRIDSSGNVEVFDEFTAKSYNETFATVTSSSNTTAIDCEAGNVFSHTLTEATTFTFSNPPASGTAFGFTLKIVQDASASGFAVTWPAAVDWAAATAPTLTDTANAVDVLVFVTHNGGTTWYGFTAGKDFS